MSDPGWRQRLIALISHQLRPIQPIPTKESPILRRLDFVDHVVFDVYGTILTSGAGEVGIDNTGSIDRRQACRRIADEYSIGGTADEIVAALEVTIRRHHSSARAKGVVQPEVDIREIWREVVDAFGPADVSRGTIEEIAIRYELLANPFALMPGFPDVVMTLAASGVRLGIVSNSQFYTPLEIEALTGITISDLGFTTTVWSYEERVAKPDPAIFERYFRRLDPSLPRDRTLYVGNDMRNDVATAAAAGCKTALFAGDARSLRRRDDDPRLTDTVPDLVVTDLAQIVAALHPKGAPV